MKKVTLQMIADRVGVSKALVSKALGGDPAVNDGTREEIRRTAQEMGYRFDKLRKSSVQRRTGNIAVLMPEAYLSDMEYWSKLIGGVSKALAAQEFSMLLANIDPSLEPEEGMPAGLADKADGALLLGHIPAAYRKTLDDLGLPYVLVDSNDPLARHHHVLANNFLGAYEATAYLLEAGHRKLAFVGDREAAWSFRERHRGFEEALRDFNQSAAEDQAASLRVRGLGVSGRGNYVHGAEFEEQLRAAISAEAVTAFFCANDTLAIETMRLLFEWKLKCPEDFSIIGFDDLSLAQFMIPKLTTVSVPKEGIGARAVESVLELTRNPDRPCEQVLLRTELIERESVRKQGDGNRPEAQ
ncbi:LacI family DNA-binding transcriptional regulator [Gorillibacterium sp. sgz500922]|uniref:LacI family DNA-binding transcriptional regulator n=1 Tax=Gorillibacterium sp. sgz500922 TaxID=3446694 RepID=UPI003F67C9E7